MKDWKRILVSPETSLRDTIRIIEDSALQIALVTDENKHLLGTVTDGDIRRGILKGITLDDQVRQIMNPNPTTASLQHGRKDILAMMKMKQLHHIPVVDEESHIIYLEIMNELIQSQRQDNWVVLMAGGLGSRLHPLTKDCPKPLLKVGSKPVLQTILENFIEYGFQRFYLAVNYKSEMIEEFFGDGSRWGVEIFYLRENQRMGTAGALGLLPDKPSRPILVMNGDILTKINFHQLLNFHRDNGSQATMCVREYDFQVPYGVVKIDKHRLIGIEEKPVHHFYVSAGIYVLDPQVLELIPGGAYFDMPNLFGRIIDGGSAVSAYPIREYWLDIGHIEDFHRANGEYENYFCG